MHSQTSFKPCQTNLYCFDSGLDIDINSCPSPNVDVDPLSSPIATPSSVDLNSNVTDDVIKDLSSDEVDQTASPISEFIELPSVLETVIKRLTTAVLLG